MLKKWSIKARDFSSVAEKSTAAAIFLLSLFRLIKEFTQVSHLTPSSDVQTYVSIARGMSHPFQVDHREPIWIWLIKGVTALSPQGDEFNAVRILGMAVFILSGVLWLRFIRKLTANPVIALVSYGVYSLNHSLIQIAVGGLRDVGFLLASVLWLHAMYRPSLKEKPVEWDAVLLQGLGFFGLIGIRLNSIFPVACFYAYFLLTKRLRWRTALGSLALGLTLISPFLYFQKLEHGDPLYSINVHASWYRNNEFVTKKGVGCEGCPSPEEMKRDSYAGEPIKTGDWLFGMHSLDELTRGTFHGYGELFFERTQEQPQLSYFKFLSGSSSLFLFALYLAGIAFLVFLKQYDAFAIALLFANVMPFLITAIQGEQRIFSQFALFVSLAIGTGAYAAWRGAHITADRLK